MARFFRRSPALETAEAPRPPRELKPQPERIGIAGSVPFVRLPAPDRLFADRAGRLRAVAEGHPLAGYLLFLSEVAATQARVRTARAEAGVCLTPPSGPAEPGFPPLTREVLTRDSAILDLLGALLAEIDLSSAPEAVQVACEALRAMPPEDVRALALEVFGGAFPLERLAECTFVAAALQVFLAELASGLDPKVLQPVADGVCPCCGGAPVASLVVGWTQADKARYLACSLCQTLWNHVRIRCTACSAGEGISYYGLDEVSKDVQVETCTTCHGYIKHLHQHRDPALDAVADDVASYGLDLKIAEEGFHRTGLNPLFVT